ncbi:MAG: hypothetical protein QGG71_21735 [Pirellulaceae bacterium]|nr:hypothetical protein [Planctomycetaceae bacterium]MDP6557304.1 hypothetical protein [Pirellulaceae bacterium]
MIALPKKQDADALQHRFMDMMPTIYDQVRFAFRHELPERRNELIAEAIANCWVSFVKLVERDLQDVIYATPLAQFAIRQVISGHKVGGKPNKNDITSEYAQKMKQITVERLTRYNKRKSMWLELLVEDRHAGPADTAAARIDFGDWLRTLGGRRRRIAETLAKGETTSVAAAKFKVSLGRISQLRRELRDDWDRFHGEDEDGAASSDCQVGTVCEPV